MNLMILSRSLKMSSFRVTLLEGTGTSGISDAGGYWVIADLFGGDFYYSTGGYYLN